MKLNLMSLTSLSRTSYSCPSCCKEYLKYSSYEKHKLVCEFLNKSKRARKIDLQEEEDKPTYDQLVSIVQNLAVANDRLEKKLDTVWKQMKRDDKIDILVWLSNNVHPKNTFSVWVNNLIVRKGHLLDLINNFHPNANATILAIVDCNRDNIGLQAMPMQCFDQKTNRFYICNNVEARQWAPITDTDFHRLMNRIQNDLLSLITIWQTTHEKDICDSDSIATLYNKAIIKIMNITLMQDVRIRSELYNLLKVELPKMQKVQFCA